MKLIKYVCDDCEGDGDFIFYTDYNFNYLNPYCPNCGQDDYVTNKGEIDAKEL
jgi:hypothetical protein